MDILLLELTRAWTRGQIVWPVVTPLWAKFFWNRIFFYILLFFLKIYQTSLISSKNKNLAKIVHNGIGWMIHYHNWQIGKSDILSYFIWTILFLATHTHTYLFFCHFKANLELTLQRYERKKIEFLPGHQSLKRVMLTM